MTSEKMEYDPHLEDSMDSPEHDHDINGIPEEELAALQKETNETDTELDLLAGNINIQSNDMYGTYGMELLDPEEYPPKQIG